MGEEDRRAAFTKAACSPVRPCCQRTGPLCTQPSIVRATVTLIDSLIGPIAARTAQIRKTRSLRAMPEHPADRPVARLLTALGWPPRATGARNKRAALAMGCPPNFDRQARVGLDEVCATRGGPSH